jgi:hypothetical protein
MGREPAPRYAISQITAGIGCGLLRQLVRPPLEPARCLGAAPIAAVQIGGSRHREGHAADRARLETLRQGPVRALPMATGARRPALAVVLIPAAKTIPTHAHDSRLQRGAAMLASAGVRRRHDFLTMPRRSQSTQEQGTVYMLATASLVASAACCPLSPAVRHLGLAALTVGLRK